MKIVRLILGLLLVLTLGSTTFSSSPEGHRIKITIVNMPDSVCYLVSYFGDRTYLTDTAQVVDHTIIFEGNQFLEKGIYILAGQAKNKYLEFIVNDEQKFSFETDTMAIIDHLSIKGSKENQLFFDYIRMITDSRNLVDSLMNLAKADGITDSAKTSIHSQIESIDQRVTAYRQNLIKQNRETFLSVFLKATTEPEVHAALNKSTNQAMYDSLFVLYKGHYWDNFDLNDTRLLRSPLFHQRLSTYMDNMVIPAPDSIIVEVDRLLLKVADNPEVFDYLLWYFTRTYEKSNIMGYDKIFVHLANTYYAAGRTGMMNETVVANIMDRARILEPLLIGKPAPEMILLDTNEVPVSLYQSEARYTIIYFWDTDCSFCKKESPRLKAFYDENHIKYDLQVYAVCIDTSMTGWKKYIRETGFNWINVNGYLSLTEDFHDLYDVHSSPVIYLLDDKKIIIAKHILTDQLLEVIDRRYMNVPIIRKEE
jgi:thiol-disulfide isomerase/thioredoxin